MKCDSSGSANLGWERSRFLSRPVPLRGQPTMNMGGSVGIIFDSVVDILFLFQTLKYSLELEPKPNKYVNPVKINLRIESIRKTGDL